MKMYTVAMWCCLVASVSGCDRVSSNNRTDSMAADPSDTVASAAQKPSDKHNSGNGHENNAGAMKSMPEPRQLSLAYEAVFGRGPALIKIEGEETNSYLYEGGDVVWLDDLAVLVAPGAETEALPVTTGTIGIFYLKPERDKFSLIKQFPTAASGSIMGNPPTWKITGNITNFPVIISTAGGVWQGTYCASTTLTEIRPEAPSQLVSFRSAFSNGGGAPSPKGAQSFDGQIVNIMKNTSFEVEYRGGRGFTHKYQRQSGTYILLPPRPEDQLPEC